MRFCKLKPGFNRLLSVESHLRTLGEDWEVFVMQVDLTAGGKIFTITSWSLFEIM